MQRSSALATSIHRVSAFADTTSVGSPRSSLVGGAGHAVAPASTRQTGFCGATTGAWR
ncbi:MAG: hypothetical protein JST54_09220 [Deltaproteobacteria bacterium]|nr:hypothetical protein [Deltaproteobacteria bacterium]